MNLDNHTIYAFVRQDIPLKHQLVQLAHAVNQGAGQFAQVLEPNSGIPYMIVLGVPDLKRLNKAENKLKEAAIGYYLFHDTDYEFGPSAIATEPVAADKKEVLASYRLWNEANNHYGKNQLQQDRRNE